MSVSPYAEIVGEAHRASTELERLRSNPATDVEAIDKLEEFKDVQVVAARNAVFGALGVNTYKARIEGEAVLEGVEAMLYASGWNAATAATMAGRLAGVATVEAVEKNPQALLVSSYKGHKHVGVMGSSRWTTRSAAYMLAGTLSRKHDASQRLCDLVAYYGGDSFDQFAHQPSWHVNSLGSVRSDVAEVPVAGLAIFDDPEELEAYSKDLNKSRPYILVGNAAVFNSLEDTGTQDDIAVRNILQAQIAGVNMPSIADLDMTAAAKTSLLTIINAKEAPIPAQAHSALIRQMGLKDLIEAAYDGIFNATDKELASSEWLRHVNLRRKLNKSLQTAAGQVLDVYFRRAGVNTNSIESIDSSVQALKTELQRRYALSLDQHLKYNTGYTRATGIGQRFQRGRVSRIKAAYGD